MKVVGKGSEYVFLKAPKSFMDASRERMRLQAVEAYRNRRGWENRPGVKLPLMADASLSWLVRALTIICEIFSNFCFSIIEFGLAEDYSSLYASQLVCRLEFLCLYDTSSQSAAGYFWLLFVRKHICCLHEWQKLCPDKPFYGQDSIMVRFCLL